MTTNGEPNQNAIRATQGRISLKNGLLCEPKMHIKREQRRPTETRESVKLIFSPKEAFESKETKLPGHLMHNQGET